jgi:hypothetical protein
MLQKAALASLCTVVFFVLGGCGKSVGIGDLAGSGGSGGGAGTGGPDGGNPDGSPDAPSSAARISGLVVDPSGTPLPGAHVRVGGMDVVTDGEGAFLVAGVDPSAARAIEVDGTLVSPTAGGRRYGRARAGLKLGAGQELTLDAPVILTPLNHETDLSGALAFDAADPHAATTMADVVVAPTGTTGVALTIPAGTRMVWPSGSTTGTLSVTPLSVGGLPFTVPGGSGFAVQVEPEGLTFEPHPNADGGAASAVAMVMPNAMGMADGLTLTASSVNPTTGELVPTGSAIISSVNGSSVMTMTDDGAISSRAGAGPNARTMGCSGLCVFQCEARTYRGRVVDQLDKPRKGIEVRLYELGVAALKGVVVAKATTNDDGIYNFPSTRLCRWQIEADGDQYERAVQSGFANEAKEFVPDLRLTSWSAPTNVEVSLVDQNGLPWSDALLFLTPAGEPANAFGYAVTDSKGIARFWGVRAPLVGLGANGKISAGYAVVGDGSGCVRPGILAPLAAGPGTPPKLDKRGYPVWARDRLVELDAIGTDKNEVTVTSFVPKAISREAVADATAGRLVQLVVKGKGISPTANTASDESAGTLQSMTCDPNREIVTATFLHRFKKATDGKVKFNVHSVKDSEIQSIDLVDDLKLISLSNVAFTTMRPPEKVKVTYEPAVTGTVVLSNEDRSVCSVVQALGEPVNGRVEAEALIPTFQAAQSGKLWLAVDPAGCSTESQNVARISSAVDYTVTNMRPKITTISPLTITATMRKLGFDFTLEGEGLSPDQRVAHLWIGDRDLARLASPPPNPDKPDALENQPENLREYAIELKQVGTSALQNKLRVTVPAGVLPEVLATRSGAGKDQRLALVVDAPGGGFAYSPVIKLTGDLLCAKSHGGCDPNAACADYVDKVECACKPGFLGDGQRCVDVDECLTANGGCDVRADCKNTPGSRTCTCWAGYEGTGTTCTDVDECKTANGGCDATNGICTNVEGGRYCSCKSGSFGDGLKCENPCAVNNGGCGANHTCTPVGLGEVTCECSPGYAYDSERGECYADPCLKNNGGCGANFQCYPQPPPDVPGCECIYPNNWDPELNTCTPPIGQL